MDYGLDLEDESNLAKKFRLETEIRATRQGHRSIQELYDVMVSLWDQMASLEPNDLINSSSYRKLQEQNHLMQFLLALRDEFEPFKRSLLGRYSVLSLQEVVSELKIEEARLRSSIGLKGKLAVEDNDGPLSKFSSLSMEAEESHEPALSEGVVGNVTKFSAASPAVAGDSRALSHCIGGSEDSHSGKESSTLKILTYNVCIWDVETQERMEALGGLIQLHSPDIICFQEVTSNIYDIFKQSSWWDGYNCSVSLQEARERPFFCMQLSRLPVKSFSCRPFRNSRMGRELCVADIEIFRGESLIVATSHLESPTLAPPTFDQLNSEERVAQAKGALNLLQSYQNVIFCGDMNWNDEVDGRVPLPQGWIDAWAELRPWLKGWTYDTSTNKMLIANRPLQKRLDRIWCKLNDFKAKKISMIGTEAIPGVSYLKEKRVRNRVQTFELPVLPSDHYGLLLEIHSN